MVSEAAFYFRVPQHKCFVILSDSEGSFRILRLRLRMTHSGKIPASERKRVMLLR